MTTSTNELAAPRTRYFTPGVCVVFGVALVGVVVLLSRFIFGLQSTTNLSNAYPWGIWISIDVATGVALAAGGFTTSFVVHLSHRERYHALMRPALLTAMIGYTFVAFGVMTDLGRFWAMWHVMLPWMWQPNSVLFEVAVCVMTYLTVLYIEFLPMVCERFIGRVHLPGPLSCLHRLVEAVLRVLDKGLGRVITAFVILGVVLSCMHQSSLGTLMVISGDKLNPLWQTPFLPLLFLLSAFSVGFPMVIFESLIASRSFRLAPEKAALSLLARFTPVVLSLYLIIKVGDLIRRGVILNAFEGTLASTLFLTEVVFGVLVPIVIFVTPSLRRSMPWLFAAATLVVLGVALNRIDVFLIGFTPLEAGAHYFPAWTEVAVTAGFVAVIVLLYRFVVLNFHVIEQLKPEAMRRSSPNPHRAAHVRKARSPLRPGRLGPTGARKPKPGLSFEPGA